MSDRCDNCGADIIDKCPRCGAPQCCPQCCKIDELQRQIGKLETALAECKRGFYAVFTENVRLREGHQ